jgi:hypothetical protein
MKPVGRSTADQQPESIEFVPNRDIERVQQEIDRLRTCWQQSKDVFTRCVRLLRAPRAVILDIVPGTGRLAPLSTACLNL